MKKGFSIHSICPIRVLEKQVTWLEFFEMLYGGCLGLVAFFVFYIEIIMLAGMFGGH